MCVISPLADPPEGKRGMSDVSPLLVVVPTLLYGAETWVLYQKQIRLLEWFHQRCMRSILGIKWQDHMSNKDRSPQESQPTQHRVNLASGAAALGWPRHKDGRRTPAQSSLLQRAPRKAQSWCSKKALQRSAEETTCTGGNQPSVIAAGGFRPRQLSLISEKGQL